jgi:hypothetical protein
MGQAASSVALSFADPVVIRLDKAEASLVIEELHDALRHITLLSDACVMRPRVSAAGSFEILGNVVSPTRDVRRGQVIRPKFEVMPLALSAGLQG